MLRLEKSRAISRMRSRSAGEKVRPENSTLDCSMTGFLFSPFMLQKGRENVQPKVERQIGKLGAGSERGPAAQI
jgi:hypothetical protein